MCGVFVVVDFVPLLGNISVDFFDQVSGGRVPSYWAMIIAALLDMAYVWDGMKGTMRGKLYVTVTVT